MALLGGRSFSGALQENIEAANRMMLSKARYFFNIGSFELIGAAL